MNKTEKIVCLLLGAALAWYLFIEMPKQSQAAADSAKATTAATTTTQAVAEPPQQAEAANPQQPSASEAKVDEAADKAEVAPGNRPSSTTSAT